MTARRCAYLTMQDETGWSIDNELAFGPMGRLGWQVEAVPWRADNIDWDRFDAMYIGSPWDYPEDSQRFMQVLEAADASRAILVNDLALVRWNMAKTYLRDLERDGAHIVPSLWPEAPSASALRDAFRHFGVGRIIVKPVISTNATNTFLLSQTDFADELGQLREAFATRPCLVQPFIGNVQSEGEFSLFYFSRQFSHAIRKMPQRGDCRVQEEHGADVVAVDPPAALRDAGMEIMQLVDPVPVYARVDFVRGPDNRFLLMELELIEPSMYLRMDREAPRRFAEAFDDYVRLASGENDR